MIILGLFAVFLLALLNAAPVAFFAMLFLGNIGHNLSFVALLPGAIAIKFIASNVFSLPVNVKVNEK
jgi:hypothetical protein